MLDHIWHIFETNVKLWNVNFKSYLHLDKPIFNLLLHFEIWKFMHNI